MAEGRAWPVFFYGQAYMGSLEPILGALFCYLLGTSAFAVALGTALTACVLALVVGRMARAIAGPWAAIYAMAMFTTTSPAFAAYMADPRGGYAMSLLLGAACLYVAARLAARGFRSESVPLRAYAGLGLLAGLAWWTSGIVAPALAAAAFTLAVGWRGRVWNGGVAAGLVGFVTGSAPWWIWNLRHNWLSMSMSESIGALPIRRTLPLLLQRSWDVVGLGQPAWPPFLLGAILLLLLVVAVVPAWIAAARERDVGARFQLLALLTFLPLFGAAYATSSFARIDTLRYLLPLLPAAGLAAGLVFALVLRRAPLAVRLIALAALIAAQPAMGRYRMKTDTQRRDINLAAPPAAERAIAAGCDVVFVPYQMHWANFASREAIPFVDPGDERYAPYARRGLLAEQPGWFTGANGIRGFLDSVGSRYEVTPASLDHLVYRVQPPPADWTRLPAEAVDRAITMKGEDIRAVLFDRNLVTRWRDDTGQSEPAYVELRLRAPASICGLTFYSADANYPLYVAVEGRTAGSTNWTPVLAPTATSGYHWSGGSVYWRNLYYTMDVRFPPAPASELRIRFPPSPRRDQYRFRLAELVLLEAAPGSTAPANRPSRADVDALAERLAGAGVQQLLADRHVSDRMAARPGNTIEVRASVELTRGVNDTPRRDEPVYTPCDLSPGTAILVPPGAAADTETTLRALGYHPSSEATPCGTLLMLATEQDACVPDPGPMAWFGDALFAWREPEQEALNAHRRFEQAERLITRQPDHPCIAPLIESALALFPDHLPALQRWLEHAAPDAPLRAERERRVELLTKPARTCDARFANGLRLEGFTVEPAKVAPGGVLTFTYYWKAPADVDYVGLATFVHFRQDRVMWQDDHEALAGVGRSQIRLQPYAMPLLVRRTVQVPDNAPAGWYEVDVGFVDGARDKRVSVKGADASMNRSVRLARAFEVTRP